MKSIKYFLNLYNIKTPRTFKEFLEANKDKNLEYCNTKKKKDDGYRENKIIYNNLIFRKIKSFKKEIQLYYKDVLMFEDYFIRFLTEGNVTHNYIKTLKEAKNILNLKYIFKDCDIFNDVNIINDIIIDEESLYLLLGYNKWRIENETKWKNNKIFRKH